MGERGHPRSSPQRHRPHSRGALLDTEPSTADSSRQQGRKHDMPSRLQVRADDRSSAEHRFSPTSLALEGPGLRRAARGSGGGGPSLPGGSESASESRINQVIQAECNEPSQAHATVHKGGGHYSDELGGAQLLQGGVESITLLCRAEHNMAVFPVVSLYKQGCLSFSLYSNSLDCERQRLLPPYEE